MNYKKEIRIFNIKALKQLQGKELHLFIFYLWHRDNKNMVNKDYASAKLAAQALEVDPRTIFRLLEKLYDKGWIDRVDGDVYINPNMGMSLMIDATNLHIKPKTESRGVKEYINNPEVREAFKKMFPEKQVDKILDQLYRTTEKPVYNWHEYAKGAISKSNLIKKQVIKSNGYGQDNGMGWD